jgi:hypothetical protein
MIPLKGVFPIINNRNILIELQNNERRKIEYKMESNNRKL